MSNNGYPFISRKQVAERLASEPAFVIECMLLLDGKWMIEDLLRAVAEDEDGDAEELHGARLASFRRAGLLTRDAGVVITLTNGSEFQISVIQSRIGDRGEDENADDDAP